MLQSRKAIEMAQTFNRNQWIKHAEIKLSHLITNAAQKGLRQLNVNPVTLFTGAENLEEIGEMYTALHHITTKAGYKVQVTPNAEIIIMW